ncbi:ABC transporter permease [Emticicia sp. BO119]|uniref:ABC transporter permease n=1 Tax=Emticicia sp. BO119 TaxID=2757768 RepID=UPI0015F0ACF7|nr:ABC transporter permease [Emticicia sp. BO119]MBA4849210.1 ABC transporter permease [Emticicia sp. BO119]
MLRNYIKIAWRNLFKNKLYSLLNIAGLTFGLICFFLIGLFVFDELTFDEQHSNADRIYRLIEHKSAKGEQTIIAGGSFKVAEESKKVIVAIENSTRVIRMGRANLINPERPEINFQEDVTTVDENFLRIFDFPLIEGTRETALTEPNTIVITEELALNRFNTTKVLGKTLKFSFIDSPLKITGVLKNHKKNSSFTFNNLLSEATSHSANYFKDMMQNDWLSSNFTVYFLLKPQSDPEHVAVNLKNLVLKNFKPEAGTTFSYNLQNLKNVHLRSEGIYDGARNSNVAAIAQGNPLYIKIFIYIALFVLLIAGINYINLSTAKASNRSKEIGVRKSLGAEKGSLIIQFLLEAFIITTVSFVLSVLLLQVILPIFNQFTNKELSLNFNTDYRIWLLAIGACIFTSLFSGFYPAFLLSSFKPLNLLKGLKMNSNLASNLRKGLVFTQFTISTVLIICTLVVYEQVKYLNNTNLGFRKDHMVVIDVNNGAARKNMISLKSEMAKISGVKNVSATSRVPGEWKTYRKVKVYTDNRVEAEKASYYFAADENFIETFNVKLLNGRNFEQVADSGAVILNETAATALNIQEANNQLITIPSIAQSEIFNTLNNPIKMHVVGIVKDFHFQSLKAKIEPLILGYIKNPIHDVDYYTARIESTNIQSTLDKLKAVMVNNEKDDPFEYHFLDEQLKLFYMEDARRQQILIWAALSTIFIACLGLFGLATYAAEQRIKEIGVRKVLGASVFSLTALLTKDFLKLVIASIIVAAPIAWWGANLWLQEYAYHINIAWWMPLAGGLLAIIIAIFTVSYNTIKAALLNPIKSLKTE